MTTDEIRSRLFALQDVKYRDFQGGAQPVTAGAPAGVSAEPGAVSTDEDVDDIMDETED